MSVHSNNKTNNKNNLQTSLILHLIINRSHQEMGLHQSTHGSCHSFQHRATKPQSAYTQRPNQQHSTQLPDRTYGALPQT